MEKVFIGIDISKLTLDIFVNSYSKTQHYQIENSSKAIKKFFKSFSNDANTVVGMENTGRYNFELYEVLSNLNLLVFVINPLHLKKSIGLLRGKNDKLDRARESVCFWRKIIWIYSLGFLNLLRFKRSVYSILNAGTG